MRDTVTPPRTQFGRKLREQMDSQRVSARELSRRLARQTYGDKATAEHAETVRRQVARWLSPGVNAVSPTTANRRAAEQALGLEVEALDDDEEADQLSDLWLTLRSCLRELIRQEAQA